ncbi:hypothetical protein CUMW_242870, partial [Citrus unshiu]
MQPFQPVKLLRNLLHCWPFLSIHLQAPQQFLPPPFHFHQQPENSKSDANNYFQLKRENIEQCFEQCLSSHWMPVSCASLASPLLTTQQGQPQSYTHHSSLSN